MTSVKMPIVNDGLCVTAFPQVSADDCKGDGSGQMQMAKGGGIKLELFADILYGCTRKPEFKPQKR